MEQTSITTEYELMFTNQLLKRLLISTRVILLKYYKDADIVAVLEDMEKQGKDIGKLGFREALDEFERRGVTHIEKLAGWLTVEKKNKCLPY